MIDCHTHTSNSPDGYDTPQEAAEQACRLALKAFAITEHCEANRLFGREEHHIDYNSEHVFHNYDIFQKSISENNIIKEKYSSRLNFINGIEFGQASHDFTAAEKIISEKSLDFIICSTHELPGHEDFAFLDYKKENIRDLLVQYFDETLKLCRWGRFDVLGHLTYPLRYIIGEAGIDTDISEFDEIIAESFRELIKNDKGIEINTSGLRQAYGKTFPELKYIKLFHDLGGKIITVGSDSHRTKDIGSGVDKGIELADAAGFRKIFYFKNHIPYGITI